MNFMFTLKTKDQMEGRDNIKTDMEELGLEEDDALDRRNWKCGIQYGDPTKRGIQLKEEEEEGVHVKAHFHVP